MFGLIGGISLSFYDWCCDLPPASPETWGEQTDVAESADWYHAKMLVSMGANIGMTRTPDCHFLAEGRHNGTKLWVFSPDFSQVSKYADEWVGLPNTNALFNGSTPLDVMLRGGIPAMERVRALLDARRGGA